MVVGEFDDSALMFSFGRTGAGIFPAPSAIASDVQRNFGVQLIGKIEDVRERFYAISREEHPQHPALVAILKAAQRKG
jgi:LysR family transcriptional activator of nhaA